MAKTDTFEGRIHWLLGEMRYKDPEESGREAGRRLNISGEIVNKWKSGDRKPSFELLLLLHLVTGVNVHWLVTGKGDPHDGAPGGRVRWPPGSGATVAARTDRRRSITVSPPTSVKRPTAPPKNRS